MSRVISKVPHWKKYVLKNISFLIIYTWSHTKTYKSKLIDYCGFVLIAVPIITSLEIFEV